MNRADRLNLIEQLEKDCAGPILVYFTGDRPPLGSRIAEDAVRIMYEHLLRLPKQKVRKLNLFMYSRGGDVSVPWRVISMLREFCETVDVLVPYKAHSAATMICIGCDRIVMGRKAELGPIDPTLSRATSGDSGAPPREISIEDVSSYVSFMRERANITDQAAMGQLVSQLATYLTPLALGRVNRDYSHIRVVARKLLSSRKKKDEEGRIATIIEALTEKMYSHGHAIGRHEAKEVGLPVVVPRSDVEKLIWKLFCAYEETLSINDPLDPEMKLEEKNADSMSLDAVPLAIIESGPLCHVFRTKVSMRRDRRMPPNPQINLNLNLALPPNIDPATLPKNFQLVLQKMLSDISNIVPKLVQKELERQAPTKGFEVRAYGGRWTLQAD